MAISWLCCYILFSIAFSVTNFKIKDSDIRTSDTPIHHEINPDIGRSLDTKKDRCQKCGQTAAASYQQCVCSDGETTSRETSVGAATLTV